jgi:anti-sigma regulatory factor (Ser/Thr protein kinase)
MSLSHKQMKTKTAKIYPICTEADIVALHKKVKELLSTLKFSPGECTEILTVISELGHNIILYAGSGEAEVSLCCLDSQNGICLNFRDKGPGIPHIEEILKNGKASSTTGLGLGLKGVSKIADEFYAETFPGKGSSIHFIKWEHS